MISRRNLMLAGIFAAASAPAIVRASSLMKIWVPPKPKLILYPMEIGRIEGFRFIQSPYLSDNECVLRNANIIRVDNFRAIPAHYVITSEDMQSDKYAATIDEIIRYEKIR